MLLLKWSVLDDPIYGWWNVGLALWMVWPGFVSSFLSRSPCSFFSLGSALGFYLDYRVSLVTSREHVLHVSQCIMITSEVTGCSFGHEVISWKSNFTQKVPWGNILQWGISMETSSEVILVFLPSGFLCSYFSCGWPKGHGKAFLFSGPNLLGQRLSHLPVYENLPDAY